MTQIEEMLTQYETDVRFPDVSGLEHLDMLMTRSRIGAQRFELTPEQQSRLLDADQRLLHHAELFYQAIASVADLAEWRNDSIISPDEWWWYLDVLISLPQPLTVGE